MRAIIPISYILGVVSGFIITAYLFQDNYFENYKLELDWRLGSWDKERGETDYSKDCLVLYHTTVINESKSGDRLFCVKSNYKPWW